MSETINERADTELLAECKRAEIAHRGLADCGPSNGAHIRQFSRSMQGIASTPALSLLGMAAKAHLLVCMDHDYPALSESLCRDLFAASARQTGA